MPKLKGFAAVALSFVVAFPLLARAQAREPQFFLVFVDDLHLDFRSTPRLRELIRKAVNALIHEGDSVALVTTGFSSVAVPPTNDLQRAASGLAHITGGGLTAAQILEPQRAEELLNRARMAIVTARDAIRVVASRATGAVVVLYFSGGYADQSLASDLAELASDAYRGNAVIYAFQPRGLIADSTAPQSMGKESAWEAYHRDARESLRNLAESTGGRLVSSIGEFDGALTQMARGTNE